MIERDPTTEPAGELVAARTCADLLLWLDGDDNAERYDQAAERLLNWKGKRLRDALHPEADHLLAQRLDTLTAQAPLPYLQRLPAVAGLVLNASALDRFIRRWLELAPEDTTFRLARLRALDLLIGLLPQRGDREIAPVARLLLHHRAVLAVDPPGPDGAPPHIHHDALLADHLYQHHGRHEPAAAELRRWFVRNAEHPWTGRLRVLRTAVLLDHLDVARALILASARSPLTANTPPGLAELATRLVVERLNDAHTDLLLDLANALAAPLRRAAPLPLDAARWLVELRRRAARPGGEPAVNAHRAIQHRAPASLDLQALPPEIAQALAPLLTPPTP